MVRSPRDGERLQGQFGFPEVKLGLLPGWGGTVRAPRVVGLSNAVELVTSGESIDAKTAAAMGLVSDVVPAAKLLAAAIRVIRAEQKSGQWQRDRERWDGPIDISDTELGFLGATASAVIQEQTGGQYPAPHGGARGDARRRRASMSTRPAAPKPRRWPALFGSPVNRALINVFFLTDRNKKDTGVDRKRRQAGPIKSVGVVGAGIMGQGIAAANAASAICR